MTDQSTKLHQHETTPNATWHPRQLFQAPNGLHLDRFLSYTFKCINTDCIANNHFLSLPLFLGDRSKIVLIVAVQVLPAEVLRAFGSVSPGERSSPCHLRRSAFAIWLEETHRTPKDHLAQNDRWGHASSPRILGSTRHGGRLGTGRSGIKSSVRQHSVRSSPPRRRSLTTSATVGGVDVWVWGLVFPVRDVLLESSLCRTGKCMLSRRLESVGFVTTKACLNRQCSVLIPATSATMCETVSRPRLRCYSGSSIRL